MTDDELNEIEARQCAGDVPALVAELRRLRAQVPQPIDMDKPNFLRWAWDEVIQIPTDKGEN